MSTANLSFTKFNCNKLCLKLLLTNTRNYSISNIMNIAELLAIWELDSNIDSLDLSNESLKIPKLHSKYYRHFLKEKEDAQAYSAALRVLKLQKYEFYTMGPNSESHEDWQLPDFGKVPKPEIARYLEGDKDLIKLETKLTMQIEKVKFLESIINGLRERGFAIKNSIDMIKFQHGA